MNRDYAIQRAGENRTKKMNRASETCGIPLNQYVYQKVRTEENRNN